MSGHKCSDLLFSAQRDAAFAATNRATASRRQAMALSRQIAELLVNATDGQKSTFANLLAEVARWQAAAPRVEVATNHNLIEQTAADNRTADAHDAWNATGSRLLERLTDAFTRQTQERGRQLERQIADISAN